MSQPDYAHEAELMRIASEAAHEAQDVVIGELGKVVVDDAAEIVASANAAEHQYVQGGVGIAEEYANAASAAEGVGDYIQGPASIAHGAEKYLKVNDAARRMGITGEFVGHSALADAERKPFIDGAEANKLGEKNKLPKRRGRNEL